MTSKGKFQDFLLSMGNFESGIDLTRLKQGNLSDFQFTLWAGEAWTQFKHDHPVTDPQYTHTPWLDPSWDLNDSDFANDWYDLQCMSINSLGFSGRYQAGEQLSIDLGYYQDDSYYGVGEGTNLWDGTWTGKNGVNSYDDFRTLKLFLETDDVRLKFIRSTEVTDTNSENYGKHEVHIQDVYILEAFAYNLSVIQNELNLAGRTFADYFSDSNPATFTHEGQTVEWSLTGLLAAAHLRGAWGASLFFVKGQASNDENGTSNAYYAEKFGGYNDDYTTGVEMTSDEIIALIEELKPLYTGSAFGGGSSAVGGGDFLIAWVAGTHEEDLTQDSRVVRDENDNVTAVNLTFNLDNRFAAKDIVVRDDDQGNLNIVVLNYVGADWAIYKFTGISINDLTIDNFANLGDARSKIVSNLGGTDQDSSGDGGSNDGGSNDDGSNTQLVDVVEIFWAWGSHKTISSFDLGTSVIDLNALFDIQHVRLRVDGTSTVIEVYSPGIEEPTQSVTLESTAENGVTSLTQSNFVLAGLGNVANYMDDFLAGVDLTTATPQGGSSEPALDIPSEIPDERGDFAEFLFTLRSFESGIDFGRLKIGQISPYQFDSWLGDFWEPIIGTKADHWEQFKAKYPSTSYPSQPWKDETIWNLDDPEFKWDWEALQRKSANSLGFVGIQAGEAVSIDTGYYEDDIYYLGGGDTNTWDGTWTGKNGINSIHDLVGKYVYIEGTDERLKFIRNREITDQSDSNYGKFMVHVQDLFILDVFGFNLSIIEGKLKGVGKTLEDFFGMKTSYQLPKVAQDLGDGTTGDQASVVWSLSGLLAAAHLRGAWGAGDLLIKGAVTSDENGTNITYYAKKFGNFFNNLEAGVIDNGDGISQDEVDAYAAAQYDIAKQLISIYRSDSIDTTTDTKESIDLVFDGEGIAYVDKFDLDDDVIKFAKLGRADVEFFKTVATNDFVIGLKNSGGEVLKYYIFNNIEATQSNLDKLVQQFQAQWSLTNIDEASLASLDVATLSSSITQTNLAGSAGKEDVDSGEVLGNYIVKIHGYEDKVVENAEFDLTQSGKKIDLSVFTADDIELGLRDIGGTSYLVVAVKNILGNIVQSVTFKSVDATQISNLDASKFEDVIYKDGTKFDFEAALTNIQTISLPTYPSDNPFAASRTVAAGETVDILWSWGRDEVIQNFDVETGYIDFKNLFTQDHISISNVVVTLPDLTTRTDTVINVIWPEEINSASGGVQAKVTLEGVSVTDLHLYNFINTGTVDNVIKAALLNLEPAVYIKNAIKGNTELPDTGTPSVVESQSKDQFMQDLLAKQTGLDWQAYQDGEKDASSMIAIVGQANWDAYINGQKTWLDMQLDVTYRGANGDSKGFGITAEDLEYYGYVDFPSGIDKTYSVLDTSEGDNYYIGSKISDAEEAFNVGLKKAFHLMLEGLNSTDQEISSFLRVFDSSNVPVTVSGLIAGILIHGYKSYEDFLTHALTDINSVEQGFLADIIAYSNYIVDDNNVSVGADAGAYANKQMHEVIAYLELGEEEDQHTEFANVSQAAKRNFVVRIEELMQLDNLVIMERTNDGKKDTIIGLKNANDETKLSQSVTVRDFAASYLTMSHFILAASAQQEDTQKLETVLANIVVLQDSGEGSSPQKVVKFDWSWGNYETKTLSADDVIDFGWNFAKDNLQISYDKDNLQLVIEVVNNNQRQTFNLMQELKASNFNTENTELSSYINDVINGNVDTDSTTTFVEKSMFAERTDDIRIEWNWNADEQVNFDPATQVINFHWFTKDSVEISYDEDQNALLIAIPTNKQNYTFLLKESDSVYDLSVATDSVSDASIIAFNPYLAQHIADTIAAYTGKSAQSYIKTVIGFRRSFDSTMDVADKLGETSQNFEVNEGDGDQTQDDINNIISDPDNLLG